MNRPVKKYKIDELQPHPKQSIVYSGLLEDKKLQASILTIGLLHKPVVVDNHLFDGKPTIVEGHRRIHNYKQIGEAEIECEVLETEDLAAIEAFFLESNLQREKTKQEIVNEFLHHKQILSQVLETKMKKGLESVRSAYDCSIFTFLNTEENVTTRELVTKRLDISPYLYNRYTILFDDNWFNKNIDKLWDLAKEAGRGFKIDSNEMDKELQRLRGSYFKGASLKSASNQMESFFKSSERKIRKSMKDSNGNQKPKNKLKPKAKKAVKKENLINIDLEQMFQTLENDFDEQELPTDTIELDSGNLLVIHGGKTITYYNSETQKHHSVDPAMIDKMYLTKQRFAA